MPIYLQHGNLIDYVSPTDTTTDDVVFMGGLVGVPQTFIPAGEVGALSVDGVYIFNKKEGVTVTLGDVVKYCGTTKLAQDSHADLTLGVAVADAEADDFGVKVKINSVLPTDGGGGGGGGGEVAVSCGLAFNSDGELMVKVANGCGIDFNSDGELVATRGGGGEVALCGRSGLYFDDGEVAIKYCGNSAIKADANGIYAVVCGCSAIRANERGFYLKVCTASGLSIQDGELVASGGGGGGEVATGCGLAFNGDGELIVATSCGLDFNHDGKLVVNVAYGCGIDFNEYGELVATGGGGGGESGGGLTDNNSFIVTGNDSPIDQGNLVNIGYCNFNSSHGSVILGTYTDNCSAPNAVVIGSCSEVRYNANGGIAIGSGAKVAMNGCGSIAIGMGAEARTTKEGFGSIVIGNGINPFSDSALLIMGSNGNSSTPERAGVLFVTNASDYHPSVSASNKAGIAFVTSTDCGASWDTACFIPLS